MRIIKALGTAIVVVVVWAIVASFVMFQLRVGQTYDATFGAWFVDPAKADDEAIWLGQAVIFGVIAALIAGAISYYRQGKRKIPPSTLPEGDRPVGLGGPGEGS